MFRCEIEFIWLGSCEHSNEPSGYIEDTELTDELSDYQLLNNGCSIELVKEN